MTKHERLLEFMRYQQARSASTTITQNKQAVRKLVEKQFPTLQERRTK